MLIVPVTRSLIYQAVAKQMAWLASPDEPSECFTTVFVDREDLCVIDDDIHKLAAPIVEKYKGQLSRACVEEVGNCGVIAFGFHSQDLAIVFARELDVAMSEIGKGVGMPRVIVWDTKQHILHEPEAPKRKNIPRAGE